MPSNTASIAELPAGGVRFSGAAVVGQVGVEIGPQRPPGHDVGRARFKAVCARLTTVTEDVKVAGSDRDIAPARGLLGNNFTPAIARNQRAVGDNIGIAVNPVSVEPAELSLIERQTPS